METKEISIMKIIRPVVLTTFLLTGEGIINHYGCSYKKIHDGIKKDYAAWQNNKQLEKMSKNSEKSHDYGFKKQPVNYQSN